MYLIVDKWLIGCIDIKKLYTPIHHLKDETEFLSENNC